jgi:hypothetical protein
VLVALLRRLASARLRQYHPRPTNVEICASKIVADNPSASPPRIIKPQVTRPETDLKPRYIQHDIQDAKGDGKGSSAQLAQPRRLTGAWRLNFMAEYTFEK